jgi:hypothetical protein
MQWATALPVCSSSAERRQCGAQQQAGVLALCRRRGRLLERSAHRGAAPYSSAILRCARAASLLCNCDSIALLRTLDTQLTLSSSAASIAWPVWYTHVYIPPLRGFVNGHAEHAQYRRTRRCTLYDVLWHTCTLLLLFSCHLSACVCVALQLCVVQVCGLCHC